MTNGGKRRGDARPNVGATSGGHSRRGVLRGLGLAAPVLLLAGCGQIVPGQRPPPNLYRLTPKSTFPDGLPKVGWQLLVEQPTASAGLSTSRIALMRTRTRLSYYANTNWTDVAPAMVQGLIIESFENSGAIVSVGREAVGLRSDFVLKSELREFQTDYFGDSGPVANVRINAKLVKMPERQIVGFKEFGQRFPAGADRMADIIEAFDEALGSVLKDLVAWTIQSGAEVEA